MPVTQPEMEALRYFGPKTTPLLDTIQSPADMKRLTIDELKQLSYELRWDVLNAVSKTGGHLGSSLGVVELTVALHAVFDTPDDKIIYDVAHQVAAAHDMLMVGFADIEQPVAERKTGSLANSTQLDAARELLEKLRDSDKGGYAEELAAAHAAAAAAAAGGSSTPEHSHGITLHLPCQRQVPCLFGSRSIFKWRFAARTRRPPPACR